MNREPAANTLQTTALVVAFRSDREGGGIFVMRRDGTAVRRLTAGGYNPAWSPAGAEVAYATVHTMASPFAAGDLRCGISACRFGRFRTSVHVNNQGS
jgi:hypothetical protein